MDPQDEEREERELLRLREICLAFVSVATRQHQDRRAGINGPTEQQLADIKLLIAAGNLQHMDTTALTMVGLMAGIAGIIVSATDNEDLLQKMILETARESAEMETRDDR